MLAAFQGIINNPIQLLQILATILGAVLIVTIFNLLIGKLEKRGDLKKGKLTAMKRFFQIIIYLMAVIIVLQLLDQDITAAIAGLGVGALVIGFGLKDIIENWISGILLISGKTYAIGDVIRVGNLTGTVTDISLRTTKMKTYDRNEIIIPNAVLMTEKIINLTSGEHEAISSITVSIDYVADIEKAKTLIENILKSHKSVIFNLKKRREIRFVFSNREWINEIEVLFWVNDPQNETFIKSNIAELIQAAFKKEEILPPIPPIMRKEYMIGQANPDKQETT
ncbi:MAG: mechanosensitive ion channel family protein [Candidatus Bathyarchaeia archaeon]|jgi:small-conductance mechanosensitive channel